MPKKDLLGQGNYPTFSGYKYQYLYPESNCKKGDLIVVARGVGGTGDVKIIKEDAYLTNLSIKIDFNPDIVDNQFFYYYFHKETLRYLDSGSAQSQITIIDLKSESFLFPKLPEQKAIASVLSSLDDKIDLLHRQNKTLEAMAETLFRQWFVEEAQEDWEVVKLDSLINISSGKGLKKEHLSENGAYPVLGANGEIGRTNEFLFDESLLFTGRVGTLGNIFRVENEKVWLSDNTLVIKPKNYFNFIYFVLKTAKLEEYNVGSTQPLIRQSDIKKIAISLPPEYKLHEFEKESHLLLKKVRQNKSQIRTLEKLRDALLPKLMSGEVRVKI
jgi:type I restriction enzyme, S subunit